MKILTPAIIRSLTLIFSFVLLSASAKADDGHAAIRSGSIVFQKTDSIKMAKEFLEVSNDRIKVLFHFKNLKNTPLKIGIAFPLPPLTCGYWAENSTVSKFNVKVDGKTIHPRMEMKAIENLKGGEEPIPFGVGKDITVKVKAAGLPINCLDTWNDKNLFKKAQKAKLAEDFQGTDPEGVSYQTEITYYWEQDFPANSTLQIEHEYKPMAGIGLHYCPYDEAKLKFKLSKFDNKTQCHLVDYVLRTAKTWSGPIGHFELTVPLSPKNSAVWSNIGPMQFDKDKTHAVFVKDDYVPEEDLAVGLWE